MTIMPLTYLGNVEYFSHLLFGGACVVDLGENWVKQSYRNRCEIMAAGGVGLLTVNVVKGGSRKKRPVKDIRIDYSKRWQHQHRAALISAYKNSPYFDHYWSRFEPFYEKRYGFLADLNVEILLTAAQLIEPDLKIEFSESHIISSEADNDLRGSEFEPIKRDRFGRIIDVAGKIINDDKTHCAISGGVAAESGNRLVDAGGELFARSGREPVDSGSAVAAESGGRLVDAGGELFARSGRKPVDSGSAVAAESGNRHASAGGELFARSGRKPVDSGSAVAAESGNRHASAGSALYFEPYWQVFSDKHPFAPNLSVIDLIFCEGPGANAIIRRSTPLRR